MKCYRKNGSDAVLTARLDDDEDPSMKCYRKNGSDCRSSVATRQRTSPLNEVLPKER